MIFLSYFRFHVCDVNLDDLEQEEEEVLLLGEPVSFSWEEAIWKEVVYGYSNGLLLLYRCQFGLTVWNPSTRRYRNLPDCPFKATAGIGFNRIIGSGFGYDESIDDYKAFLMVDVLRGLEYEIQVWIFGLRLNVWRKAQNFPFPEYRIHSDHGNGYFTTEDGSVHWLCTHRSIGWQTEIAAFDVRKETFSLVFQPVCCSVEGVNTELHVLEGCLYVSYFYSGLSTPQADLHIRKKNGEGQFTWTKVYSVKETKSLLFHISWFDLVNVLGYSKRGDKILLDFGRDFMVSYDLKEKSFAKVEVVKDPNWRCPILCHESLVSVGGGA